MNDSKLMRGKVVLIVDDEELVREVTVMMLEDCGASTLTAADGQSAVDLFRKEHSRISAVFMDFSMPLKNGFEAFEEMQAINPSVPVILVSGLKITPEAQAARAAGKLEFLGKPFKQNDVVAALERVWGRTSSASSP